jgi:hypothetical protein
MYALKKKKLQHAHAHGRWSKLLGKRRQSHPHPCSHAPYIYTSVCSLNVYSRPCILLRSHVTIPGFAPEFLAIVVVVVISLLRELCSSFCLFVGYLSCCVSYRRCSHRTLVLSSTTVIFSSSFNEVLALFLFSVVVMVADWCCVFYPVAWEETGGGERDACMVK